MKKAPVLFVAAVLLLCLVPTAGLLLFGPAGAGANEVLSPLPVLVEDGRLNGAYLSELADYVADRFYPRQALITAGRKLESAVFRSSGEEDVILGRDGWLFYASTLDDYTGASGLTDREVYAAANNLALMAEYCGERDIRFLFAAAPNKNTLYGSYMPDFGAVSSRHTLHRLQALLSEMEVPYVDLVSLFEGRDEPLYFAHDSHWTSRGAALAADALNAAFGLETNYFSGNFTPESHTGDLYEMLYPAAADPETDAVYTPALPLTYEGGGAVRPDSITITALGSGQRRLFAYRDSFGNSLYPYLADSSAWSRFSRSSTYDLTALEALEADCLLIELVERNLGNLIDAPPVLPAPERAVEPTRQAENRIVLASEEGPAGLRRLSGRLPGGVDPSAPVYVVCGGRTFQALLTREGFAAYVPADLAPERVLVYAGGELASCAAAENPG